LEEEHAGSPDRRAAPIPGQDVPGDHGLNLEEQVGTCENANRERKDDACLPIVTHCHQVIKEANPTHPCGHIWAGGFPPPLGCVAMNLDSPHPRGLTLLGFHKLGFDL